jgi:hypothetical protein
MMTTRQHPLALPWWARLFGATAVLVEDGEQAVLVLGTAAGVFTAPAAPVEPAVRRFGACADVSPRRVAVRRARRARAAAATLGGASC